MDADGGKDLLALFPGLKESSSACIDFLRDLNQGPAPRAWLPRSSSVSCESSSTLPSARAADLLDTRHRICRLYLQLRRALAGQIR
jgi:hypothetical protein